jgi:hypothetical protein
MDTGKIKNMMQYPPISDQPEGVITTALVGIISKIYKLSGLLRGINTDAEKEAIKDEIKTIALTLSRRLLEEPKLSIIRLPELDYCLMCGIEGEFDKEVKTFGINYSSIFKWIKEYVFSQDRINAHYSYEQDKPKLQLEQKTELSDAENDAMMKEAINNAYAVYCEQMNAPELLGKIKHISEIINPVGRKEFLVRMGLMDEKMTVSKFFERCLFEEWATIFE